MSEYRIGAHPYIFVQYGYDFEEQFDEVFDTIADAGYRIVKRHRNWEIYPHEIPPRLKDWLNIYWLNRRYGSGGNVFTVLAKKSAR